MSVIEIIKLPESVDNQFPFNISGFHGMPDKFYTFRIKQAMDEGVMGNIDTHGFPIIPVTLINPENSKELAIKAVIDTGAAICLLQPRLISLLGLLSYNSGQYLHPQNGLMSTSYYKTDLLIESTRLTGLRVGELHAADYPAGMIIGVELLKYCRFVYDGLNKEFELLVKITH